MRREDGGKVSPADENCRSHLSNAERPGPAAFPEPQAEAGRARVRKAETEGCSREGILSRAATSTARQRKARLSKEYVSRHSGLYSSFASDRPFLRKFSFF